MERRDRSQHDCSHKQWKMERDISRMKQQFRSLFFHISQAYKSSEQLRNHGSIRSAGHPQAKGKDKEEVKNGV